MTPTNDPREDGPFDIDEVDLADDPIQRLDLGTVIVTPSRGFELQLQMNKATKAVASFLAKRGNSGLEVSLFAAPRTPGFSAEVRQGTVDGAVEAGGEAEVVDGPFGPEVRRTLRMTGPDNKPGLHVSRVWLVEGPRWVLRGTLMGQVCVTADEAEEHEFVEFFKNLVVRRGSEAKPAGDVVPMSIPEEAAP